MEQLHVSNVIPRPHSPAKETYGIETYVEQSFCGPSTLETNHQPIAGYLGQYNTGLRPKVSTIPLNTSNDILTHEGQLDGGPLSTCSSTSYTGGVSALPTDIQTNLMVNSPIFPQDQAPRNNTVGPGKIENYWQHNYDDMHVWALRQLSQTIYNHPANNETFLPTIGDCIFQHGSPNCIPNYELTSCGTRIEDLSLSQPNLAIEASVNEKYVGSEPEQFNKGAFDFSCQVQECKIERREEKLGVSELGKVGSITHPFQTAIGPRYYECPLMNRKAPQSLCARRFQRSSHLRRHITTVHGNESCHPCRVCSKAFSRLDNLRQHYWTHLRREGKVGQNIKISLLELSAILGSQERPFVKRLHMKLNKAKQANAKL